MRPLSKNSRFRKHRFESLHHLKLMIVLHMKRTKLSGVSSWIFQYSNIKSNKQIFNELVFFYWSLSNLIYMGKRKWIQNIWDLYRFSSSTCHTNDKIILLYKLIRIDNAILCYILFFSLFKWGFFLIIKKIMCIDKDKINTVSVGYIIFRMWIYYHK